MNQDVKREFFPSWIRNIGLEPGPAWLYVCLLSRRDIKTGLAWPSVSTLCADTGTERKTVQRNIKTLEREGFIFLSSGRSTGNSNQYLLWEPNATFPQGKAMPVPKLFKQPGREGQKRTTGGVKNGLGGGSKTDYNHIPEINTKDQNQYSPNTSEQRSKANSPILGKPEIEAILEALNLPDSIYGHVHARMEAMKWRTPENRSFRSRASASRFLEGLAGRMEPLKT